MKNNLTISKRFQVPEHSLLQLVLIYSKILMAFYHIYGVTIITICYTEEILTNSNTFLTIEQA